MTQDDPKPEADRKEARRAEARETIERWGAIAQVAWSEVERRVVQVAEGLVQSAEAEPASRKQARERAAEVAAERAAQEEARAAEHADAARAELERLKAQWEVQPLAESSPPRDPMAAAEAALARAAEARRSLGQRKGPDERELRAREELERLRKRRKAVDSRDPDRPVKKTL